jgi:hypothetical protein
MKGKKTVFLFLFIAINTLLSCFYIDVWMSPNAVSRALPVLSLYEDNSLIIDKYKDKTGDISLIKGHYYSDKAPLSSFLVYPAYSLYKKAGFSGFDSAAVEKYPIYIWEYTGMKDGRTFISPHVSTVMMLGSIITGSIPFILIILFTFLTVRLSNNRNAVLLAMLPFYATFLFVYSGVYFGHLLAAFFLLSAYILMRTWKNLILAGFALGLAFATEYTIAIIIPFWLIQLCLREKAVKPVVFFLGGLLPGFILVILYNHMVTNEWFTSTYSYIAHEQYKGLQNVGFGKPDPAALWGLLFPSNRGVFFYAPLLIYLLWSAIRNSSGLTSGFFKNSRKEFYLPLAGNYLMTAVVVYLVLMSAYFMWTGGWSYGPRHLIPVAALALYEGAFFLSRRKFSMPAFLLFSAAGLFCTWLAKSTKLYMLPDWPNFLKPVSQILIPDFMEGKYNANNILTWVFGTSPGLANFIWILLFITSVTLLHFWYGQIAGKEPILASQPPLSVKPTAKNGKTNKKRKI